MYSLNINGAHLSYFKLEEVDFDTGMSCVFLHMALHCNYECE